MAGKSTKSSTASGQSRKKHAAGTGKTSLRILRLKAQLGIREAVDLKARLGKLLESGGREVALDASKVEKVDTAIMQLLTAFYRSAKAQGIEVKWKNPSEGMLRSAELLGLRAPLGLEHPAPLRTG